MHAEGVQRLSDLQDEVLTATMIGLGALAAMAAAQLGSSPEVLVRHEVILNYMDLEDCLRNEALKADFWGKSSPREDVITNEGKCGSQWAAFRTSFLEGVDSPSLADLKALEYFHSLAVGTAASELVEGRIGSCGTAPGPYQCKAVHQHSRK